MEMAASKKEIDASKANLLEQYGGYFCGEVYLTARDMFSRYKVLEETSFRFSHDTGEYMFAATPDPENPQVTININPEQKLDSRMNSRLKDRFNLSEEVVAAIKDDPALIRPLILAHELAHLLQIDPNFTLTFGGDYVNQSPDVNGDYAGYLMSDPEVTADYIAASIIGNTPYGAALGIEMPEVEPAHWRAWSEQRPMTDTINQFSGVGIT